VADGAFVALPCHLSCGARALTLTLALMAACRERRLLQCGLRLSSAYTVQVEAAPRGLLVRAATLGKESELLLFLDP
jgi:hypothetical protein